MTMYYDIKRLAELAAEIKDSGSIDLVAGLADMAFCKGAITLISIHTPRVGSVSPYRIICSRR